MDPLPILERLRAGDPAGARQLAEAELGRGPHSAELLCLYANACTALGDAENAAAALEVAQRLRPEFAPVWIERAALARLQGKPAEQRECLEQALMRAPANLRVALDLSRLCVELREIEQAELLLDSICSQTPNTPEAWVLRAQIKLAQRDRMAAQKYFDQCLHYAPGHAAALEGAALIAEELGQVEREIELRRARLAINPTDARSNTLLAETLLGEERVGEARFCLATALRSEPGNLYVRWRHLNALPPVVDSAAQAQTLRAEWWQGMGELENALHGRRIDARQALALIDSSTNFYLHYLGEPLIEAQRRYGAFVRELARQAFPDADEAPQGKRGSRLRVGFVSSHFHQHTVLKLFQGWVTGLPRERFETFVFHLDPIDDEWTARIRARVDHFHGAQDSVARWVPIIREAKLDLLIHLDVAMHPHSQTLAALRLAPVQATTWGHPITTGMDSVDFYLSSAAMEAPDADRHYSEKLVRLPRLGVSYGAPSVAPDDAYRPVLPVAAREYLFCPQSAQKLHPGHDLFFADLAARCPDLPLVLVPHNKAIVREQLANRMRGAFASRGLDFDRHVVITPGLSNAQFLAVARGARLMVDALDWSGCNTALETLWFDVPLITCPGDTMRSRHSAAFLDLLDLSAHKVDRREDYAERTAQLAHDDAALRSASHTIAANKAGLFSDPQAVPALARWIEEAVGR